MPPFSHSHAVLCCTATVLCDASLDGKTPPLLFLLTFPTSVCTVYKRQSACVYTPYHIVHHTPNACRPFLHYHKLCLRSQLYTSLQTKLCVKEKVLLQTIDFQIAIELPFTHVVAMAAELAKNSTCTVFVQTGLSFVSPYVLCVIVYCLNSHAQHRLFDAP